MNRPTNLKYLHPSRRLFRGKTSDFEIVGGILALIGVLLLVWMVG